MLKKIRIILEVIFFALLVLLFLDFSGTFSFIFGWTAKCQFIPALLAANFIVLLILIILTLIFGRLYCSIICPLGVMQDFLSWLFGRFKKNRFSFSKEKKLLRYFIFLIFIISLIFGGSFIVSLLDPYASFGRIISNLLSPIYIGCNNLLAKISEFFNSYAFYHVDIWIKGWLTFLIAIITFIIIAILSFLGGRTYCNTICPIGTFLGILSRFSFFKVRLKGEACKACKLCEKNCKASAIDINNLKIDSSRCVSCGNCIEKCNNNALIYSKPLKVKENKEVDTQRRMFLLGFSLFTTASLTSKVKENVHGGLAKIEDKIMPKRVTEILPPGAISKKNFHSHCTACGLCISACPNEVLRPSNLLENLMQPTISYERGYCNALCQECSKVCPTSAIKPISKEEKSSLMIGKAVWIKKNCIPVINGTKCSNCYRHCPTSAITMVPLNREDENSVLIPAIDETRCIGCGACEYLCPSRPFSAIYVEGYEQQHFY